MVVRVVLILLVAAAACSASTSRIVGGAETSIEQYPGIVQVEVLNIFIWIQSCAANVLTSRYLVSTAYCFSGIFYSPQLRRIRAGSSTRHSGGQVVGVASAQPHPSYTWTLPEHNDISVVLLQEPLVFSDAVQTISIVAQNSVLPDNLPVVQAGWGYTSEGGYPSSVLRDVTVLTVNTQVCRERYLNAPRPAIVTDDMICAGLLDVGGRDTCTGDAGGPMYYRDGARDILVGVVSWGIGCANGSFPGVSTRVASYTNWIVATAV